MYLILSSAWIYIEYTRCQDTKILQQFNTRIQDSGLLEFRILGYQDTKTPIHQEKRISQYYYTRIPQKLDTRIQDRRILGYYDTRVLGYRILGYKIEDYTT